jgi:hypothetical protein
VLAVGLVAHPSREAFARRLAEQVSADVVMVDTDGLGCEANHRATQQALAEFRSTWAVVLEDDAVPVGDFRVYAEQALAMAPAPIVSFYLGKQRPPHWQKRIAAALAEAETTGAHWIVGKQLLHAVGYAIRTDLLPSLLEHTSNLPADAHIGSFARANSHPIAYTVPSLVNHMDIPTVTQHPDGQPRRKGRTAWAYGSPPFWTSNTVVLR